MNATDLRDDPRLTAYALGELDPDQRVEVERLLAADPAARAELERIAEMSAALGAELGREVAAGAVPGLTAAQRAAIARAASSTHRRPWTWAVAAGGAALAAGLLVVVAVNREDRTVFAMTQSDAILARQEPDGLRYSGNHSPAESPVTAAAAGSEVPAASAIAAPATPTAAPSGDVARSEAVPNDKKEVDEKRPTLSIQKAGTGAPLPPTVALSPLPAASPPPSSSAPLPEDAGSSAGFQVISSASTRSARVAQDAVAPSGDAKKSRMAVVERRYASAPIASPNASPVASPSGSSSRPSAADAGQRERSGRKLASSPGFTAVDEPSTLPATAPASGESYNQRADNPFLAVHSDPLSTFSLDVDTASYSNVRRFIEAGRLPPRDAVRIEELVNYFPYRYEPPHDGMPFAINVEVAPCPWNQAHQLARIALKAKELAVGARPPANLVFLIDVSGSMQPANRLPLIKTGLSLLTQQLGADDRVAIVTYANGSGVALPPTSGADKRTILRAIDRLEAAGGTNGGAGIQLAYETARANFMKSGANRVILCTDGDFNVGVTDRGELVRMIQGLARTGVFLSVLGVGQDNLQDATMELLADKGNGHYAYLDTTAEAHKVLIEQLEGTLVAVAKDVKVQVEFNPARVAGYHLLGYEKRALAAGDFADDRKDAGDIGAGHTVTALYELAPAGEGAANDGGLRYQAAPAAPSGEGASFAHELMTVKLRFKEPASDTSRLIVGPVTDSMVHSQPSAELRLAAAVAEYGMLLRGVGEPGMGWSQVREQAQLAARVTGMDYASEFVHLVERTMVVVGLGGRER